MKNGIEKQIENNVPHRRFNPLSGEWILVSPQRATRPWQGQVEESTRVELPEHDADCYLCSGNVRVNGEINPTYRGPFVFDNDFPALLEDVAACDEENDALFQRMSVSGVSKVICFSERHDLTLPEMSVEMIRSIVDVWAALYEALGKTYRWVQVFENKGAINGCSNPHPHGQLWASDAVPTLVAREDERQKAFMQDNDKNLLLEYSQREILLNERVVLKNAHWVVVVPYWATWPFETLLLPRRSVDVFAALTSEEKDSLAAIIQLLTIKYDNLFQASFPYSMGWHCAPNSIGETEAKATDHWQLHAHFYPPLLRSATIRKFMVGYEMLAEAQRDMTPEQAAERLRTQPETHFKTNT